MRRQGKVADAVAIIGTHPRFDGERRIAIRPPQASSGQYRRIGLSASSLR